MKRYFTPAVECYIQTTFGFWEVKYSYGKELRKTNWNERGKENCKDSIFQIAKGNYFYETGNKIKKQGINFKPQTANNVAANSKLHI